MCSAASGGTYLVESIIIIIIRQNLSDNIYQEVNGQILDQTTNYGRICSGNPYWRLAYFIFNSFSTWFPIHWNIICNLSIPPSIQTTRKPIRIDDSSMHYVDCKYGVAPLIVSLPYYYFIKWSRIMPKWNQPIWHMYAGMHRNRIRESKMRSAPIHFLEIFTSFSIDEIR